MKKVDFKMKVPSWLRNVTYAIMFLETVLVVIMYHTPALFVQLVGLFS